MNLGGLGQGMNFEQASQMLQNPQYQQMMREMLNNPNYLNMILESPQLKPLIDSNPQVRQMFQNPQAMQNILNMFNGGLGGQSK